MAGKELRSTIRRGSWSVFGGAMAASICCAVKSVETTPLALVITLFITPSIVIFLLLEQYCSQKSLKYLGFILPAGIAIFVGAYQVMALRAQAQIEGVSDGTKDILLFFLQCYFTGLCGAFFALLLKSAQCRSQVDCL
jgi:uncharacterized membrane protein YgdD (TMEM256/DUF423 family)